MNPVQPPHHVSREMNRRADFPMIVDVIAHVLDQFRNEMCSYRFVLAALDRDAARTIVPRVRADSGKRFALQTKNQGGAKPERAPFQCSMDCADRSVILPEAVSCVGSGSRLRCPV